MPIIDAPEFAKSIFDYIVVGGGTAGLTLAARLSEDPDIRVGVIEAGNYEQNVPELDIPGLRGAALGNPAHDWAFESTPQPHANDREIPQNRGRALGGSSMINFLCLFRPTKEEYDALEKLGNKGWNWESLLKSHIKSETTIPSGLSEAESLKYAVKSEPNFHGTDGPLIKSIPTSRTKLHAAYFDAAEKFGIQRNPEAYGGRNTGSFTCYVAVDPRTATRTSARSGYYEPNATRPNLLVLLGAQVTKVILDDTKNGLGLKKVTGVQFAKATELYQTQTPTRDIVLSTGTFKTPQILELSGIGNKDILRDHSIECNIHLPGVGENMQDHIFSMIVAEVDPRNESIDVLQDPFLLEEQLQLHKEKKGLLTTPYNSAFSFVPLQAIGNPTELQDWCRLADEHCLVDVTSIHDKAIRLGREKTYVLQRQWYLDVHQPQIEWINWPGHYPLPPPLPAPEPGKRYATLLVALCHPFSRGSTHITTSDPLEPPAIDVAYFKNPADLDVLTRGMRLALSALATAPLSAEVKRVVAPAGVDLGAVGDASSARGNVESGSEAEKELDSKLRAHIRETVGPVYHAVGTAAMLPKEQGGVVDDRLKVYGTSNLRVVDLSILPIELSVHTAAAAYAIGEKAADILRERVYIPES